VGAAQLAARRSVLDDVARRQPAGIDGARDGHVPHAGDGGGGRHERNERPQREAARAVKGIRPGRAEIGRVGDERGPQLAGAKAGAHLLHEGGGGGDVGRGGGAAAKAGERQRSAVLIGAVGRARDGRCGDQIGLGAPVDRRAARAVGLERPRLPAHRADRRGRGRGRGLDDAALGHDVLEPTRHRRVEIDPRTPVPRLSAIFSRSPASASARPSRSASAGIDAQR